MKEILFNSQTGQRMVKRIALTRNGVKVSTFAAASVNDEITLNENDLNSLKNADYSYICSDIVSEQTNWLDIGITIYNKVALYKPSFEIFNAFSEGSKILIVTRNTIVKVFDVGGMTGKIEFDFLENDEPVSNPENPEDTSEYFKNSGFMIYRDDDGCASPIILNPYTKDIPVTATITLVGNTNPAASGVFKMTVLAI